MGLLALGTPLHWNEGKPLAEHVRTHGVVQLLSAYSTAAGRQNDVFLWGDEIEYMMVKMDAGSSHAALALEHDDILERLGEGGKDHLLADDADVLFHPEYGRYMLEATPLKPYNSSLESLVYVEDNMKKRRALAISQISDPDVHPLTLTTFPNMGVGAFTHPATRVSGQSSKSLFLPDEIINTHVRFPTLTANIRRRRGSKVAINIPLFQDTNTRGINDVDPSIPKRSLFPYSDSEAHNGAALPGHIYMDAMGFGMGSSCLQVTMQLQDINQARYLYDSLVNVAPLMLAISAAAPVFRGHLADQDVRWNVISQAVDCRTPAERSTTPLPDHQGLGGCQMFDAAQKSIPKSRYDSVDQYLGDINSDGHFKYFKPEYNDLDSPVNEKVKTELTKQGMDDVLANHFGHLFIRDPIVIFDEDVHQDDTQRMDHFENIQSTNWQTLRFKVPAQNSGPNSGKPGWRVELRPMEIQLTDFENAAYSVFSILLSRMIVNTNLDWYLPISLVEINMKRAHSRDAINREKFYFKIPDNGKIVELTTNEIFNGSAEHEWLGYIPMVKQFIAEDYGKEGSTNERLNDYLTLISGRASGEIKTIARVLRELVMDHPEYQNDSIINDKINYDICNFAQQVSSANKDALLTLLGAELASKV